MFAAQAVERGGIYGAPIAVALSGSGEGGQSAFCRDGLAREMVSTVPISSPLLTSSKNHRCDGLGTHGRLCGMGHVADGTEDRARVCDSGGSTLAKMVSTKIGSKSVPSESDSVFCNFYAFVRRMVALIRGGTAGSAQGQLHNARDHAGLRKRQRTGFLPPRGIADAIDSERTAVLAGRAVRQRLAKGALEFSTLVAAQWQRR